MTRTASEVNCALPQRTCLLRQRDQHMIDGAGERLHPASHHIQPRQRLGKRLQTRKLRQLCQRVKPVGQCLRQLAVKKRRGSGRRAEGHRHLAAVGTVGVMACAVTLYHAIRHTAVHRMHQLARAAFAQHIEQRLQAALIIVAP